MKQVLSLLTAFVFLQMQTWALSGGPVFPTGAPNQAGVYSGVMVQTDARFGNEFEAPNSGTTSNRDNPAGNIGVFSVTIPTDGLATGDILVFINGTIFTGTISGVADPDRRTFDGILQATAQGLVQIVTAQGQMKTTIRERTTTPQPGRTNLDNGNAARMEGKATIDAAANTNLNLTPIPLVQTKYTVSGFRQLTTALP